MASNSVFKKSLTTVAIFSNLICSNESSAALSITYDATNIPVSALTLGTNPQTAIFSSIKGNIKMLKAINDDGSGLGALQTITGANGNTIIFNNASIGAIIPLAFVSLQSGSGTSGAQAHGDSIIVWDPTTAKTINVTIGSYNHTSNSYGYVEFHGAVTTVSGDLNVNIGSGNSDFSGYAQLDNGLTTTGNLNIQIGDYNNSGAGSTWFNGGDVKVNNGSINITTGNSGDNGGSVWFNNATRLVSVPNGNINMTTGHDNTAGGGAVGYLQTVNTNGNLNVVTGSNNSGGSGHVRFQNSSTAGGINVTTGNSNLNFGGYVQFDGPAVVTNTGMSLTTGTENRDDFSSYILIIGGLSTPALTLNLADHSAQNNTYGGAVYLLTNYNALPVINTLSTLNVNSNNDAIIGSVFQLTGASPIINLSSNALTASVTSNNAANNILNNSNAHTYASNLKFSGTVVVNTKFNGSTIGNIIMDGSIGGGVTRSTLDLSGATSVVINLDAQTQTVGQTIHLPIFSTSDINNTGAQGLITPPSVNGNPTPPLITLAPTSNPNHLMPIVWSYDQATYTLTGVPTPIPSSVLSGVGTSKGGIAIFKSLVGACATSPAAVCLMNNISCAASLEEAANNLMALEVTSASEDASSAVVGSTIAFITRRIIEEVDSVLILTEDNGSSLGMSAGDPEFRNGGWVNGFALKAKQKTSSITRGYNLKTSGGGVGYDTWVNENNMVGLSWTMGHSIIQHLDNFNGNKTSINHNILSLYGMNSSLPNDWILLGTIAGGFSNTRSAAVRKSGATITVASGKYKSYYSGIEAQLLKRIALLNSGALIIEPMINLHYSFFHDDSYTENGGVVNWKVDKRSSHNLESTVGGRLISRHDYETWHLKPYISSYAHVTLIDNRGNVRTSLDRSTQVVFPQTKASPVWYSEGVGAVMRNGNVELDLTYHIELDNKYVGHQGTIKVRVEF